MNPALEEGVPNAEVAHGRRRVGILSGGIWASHRIVEELLDAEPVRVRAAFVGGGVDEIAGWGHKPTAERARAVAAARGLPYVALEDGFFRSVRPGTRDPAIGWIVDRSGIYYDAGATNDLEAAVARRAEVGGTDLGRMTTVLAEIRRRRLSKYNHAPLRSAAEMGLPVGRDVVLVVDQTAGDASVAGAFADAGTFERMLRAAIEENPGRAIVVKVHPETISGAKRGHLIEAARRAKVTVVAEDANPWSLIDVATRVYVVSSQFGLEALTAGVPVTCFGAAAYAGWGLTDDRFPAIARREARPLIEAFAAAALVDYCRWIDPWSGREIDLETGLDALSFLRDRFHERTKSVCFGFSRWKRKAVTGFLDGVGGLPTFVRTEAEARARAATTGARIVVWGSRPVATGEGEGTSPIVRAEDGFLRSVGLGASFVAPASLVFDDVGIYYDPSRPSRFEVIAETAEFSAELIERAARLRREIVERRLSKYNDATTRSLDLPTDRRRILVPGQVQDDASVRLGSPAVPDNLTLLERVRRRNPDAFVIFKPHPDVQAGYRKGGIPEPIALAHADLVVKDVAISSLLDDVDAVETMTSLTGFEALIRGVPVTTHGAPFYSGWGLTEDLWPVARRTRRLSLDELVAATLILYPTYCDPETGQPCPVEVIVGRLSEAVRRDARTVNRLRRTVRHGIAWTSHNVLGPLFGRLKF